MKAFVISKFLSPGSVISFNKEMRMSINCVVLYFVRRGMDKVAKLTVPREYEDGGLRMSHLEHLIKSQRIVCLKRYLGGTESTWKVCLSHYLKNVRAMFSLHSNFNRPNYHAINKFLLKNGLTLTWLEFNSHALVSTCDILNEIRSWFVTTSTLINKHCVLNKKQKKIDT